MGAKTQTNKQLIKPVNLMEKNEDISAKWRKYVNFQLKTKYKKLYSQLKNVIYLKTPSFNLLRSWRIKQEKKLKTKKTIHSKIMTNKEVIRFMMTYERLTLQMFKDMPKISKAVLSINKLYSTWEVIGYVDDNPNKIGKTIDNIEVYSNSNKPKKKRHLCHLWSYEWSN